MKLASLTYSSAPRKSENAISVDLAVDLAHRENPTGRTDSLGTPLPDRGAVTQPGFACSLRCRRSLETSTWTVADGAGVNRQPQPGYALSNMATIPASAFEAPIDRAADGSARSSDQETSSPSVYLSDLQ